jgi:predicted nucleic acid-binding protein
MHEKETTDLLGVLADWSERASSTVARVELLRAVRRIRAGAATRRRAEEVLKRVALVDVDQPVLSTAATVNPPLLRTLDAIHLATALSLGDELGAVTTYDGRLGAAVHDAGILVLAPGRQE